MNCSSSAASATLLGLIAVAVPLAAQHPTAADPPLVLTHAIDERGGVAEGAEDDRFQRGEDFWLVVDLPADRVGLRPVPLCLVWRGPDGEVLERALAVLPAGEARWSVAGPPNLDWPEGRYRLEVLAPTGAARSCGGPLLAEREFDLMTGVAREAPPPEPPALPDFPWPPPQPTGRLVLERELIARPRAPTTVGEVAERLTGALDRRGYGNRSFYGVPGGFALATQLEQIEEDGRSKEGPQRWSAALPPREIFDFGSFLEALFAAPEGHYRVVVFVARPGGTPVGDEASDQQVADRWALGGVDVLPASVGDRPWTEHHRVTALIYQFRLRGHEGRPEANPDGAPTALVHLENSGLLDELRAQAR